MRQTDENFFTMMGRDKKVTHVQSHIVLFMEKLCTILHGCEKKREDPAGWTSTHV